MAKTNYIQFASISSSVAPCPSAAACPDGPRQVPAALCWLIMAVSDNLVWIYIGRVITGGIGE